MIVSDHGFKKFTKEIRPVNALEAAGLGKKVYVLPEGGAGFVYIEDRAVTAKAHRSTHAASRSGTCLWA